MNLQPEIEQLLLSTGREGIQKVVDYLKDSDFYTAPASSSPKYHNCKKGGLAEHSMNVYKTMSKWVTDNQLEYRDDTIIIVSLLHDICKINTYEPNVLKSGSVSEAKPYKKNDKLAIGHGEKSVIILLQLGLQLSDEEILGIRWHMNAFDDIGYYKCADNWNDLSKLCFMADYFSTTFLEE